jgi:hypothetical protein
MRVVGLAWRLLMWSPVNARTDNDSETGGAIMSSINRIFFTGAVISAAAAVFVASGCSVAGAGMQRAAEVRVATTLEVGSPKLIVSGPARLLHVDVHGRQSLNVYSVKRGADGKVSCTDKVPAARLSLRHGASNELNLVVRADEAICMANDASEVSPRNADVSWHARRGADAPAEVAHAPHGTNL